MLKIISAFVLCVFMVGCGEAPLTEEEEAALTRVFGAISDLRGQYREFDKVYENVQRGPSFISYVNDLNNSGGSPLMSSSYFWVKVSFSKRAVDSMDMQPPVLTLYIPRFNKYLKLRLTTFNAPLEAEIIQAFHREAVELGGEGARWGTPNQGQGPGTRRRGSRRFI